jgi:methenyltetrahydromethanopterin cyclohydrolase
METEIIEQIVISIEAWKDYEKIGEEVRAMEEAISKEAENNVEPVIEFLLEVIRKYNDYDLGKILRGVYIPLKVIVNDSPDT